MPNQPRRLLFVLIFLAIGFICELLLWQTHANPFLVVVLSPVLFAAYWIEQRFSFLVLTPFMDELVFVFPTNLIYFGITSYWLKRILEERGFFKIVLLVALLIFIVFLHWQAALSLRATFPFLKGLNLPEGP